MNGSTNGSVVEGCAEARRLLGARHDNELDPVSAVRVERHLAGCEACREDARSLERLGAALKDPSLVFTPPRAFSPALPTPGPRGGVGRFLPIAASLVAGSLLTLGALRFSSRSGERESGLAREIVAAQIRATLPGHLTDVVSSDRHTVKPWFAGKLDYSPPVIDLADEGFPLEGGRLDYLGGRTVAALVYGRRLHVINLFVWPSAPISDDQTSSESGFHTVHWTAGGMAFWAVSDLESADLARFRDAFRSRMVK